MSKLLETLGLKKTSANMHLRVGADPKTARLLAAYVRSDGAVCGTGTDVVLRIDPQQTWVYTRGSVVSAVLEIGYNRVNDVSEAKVQKGLEHSWKDMWTLEDYLQKHSMNAKDRTLWSKVCAAYGVENEAVEAFRMAEAA